MNAPFAASPQQPQQPRQAQSPHPQQPEQTQPPQPQQRSERPPARAALMRGGPAPLIAAVLAVLAAALFAVGTFYPTAEMRQLFLGQQVREMLVTPWHRTIIPPPQGAAAQYYAASHVPLYGIPLCVIAGALFAGAVVTLLTVRRGGGAARVTLTAASAAAVAAAVMLAMDVESTLSYQGADPTETAASQTLYNAGLGFWLIAIGATLALLSTVLVLPKAAEAGPEEPASSVDKTPQAGIPAQPEPPAPPRPSPRPKEPGDK
ncbi:hypothetical protein ORV05_07050 [Amycolatopsis cynarae]|uniref:Uncharacterized protein n=1 Tax=Amycolatopsis cynarae TaxID=2995223 RepID=A0ABY7B5C7_9PSEU|nr:hypothetical protein [Amycolatopsis sp. HUAS 11-8]WAL67532.1 hypothetical protein ORV05_07050 [Amycolatopsis sp. HUAS 11-8]